eukprot:GEMP01014755.1.p1 GENE.GEMP01014755.1~~GEMP01014755.1.p1  ORF type:complete len:569 (-),score=141.08 GEMP01014755.1:1237-2943(-)
MASQPDAASPLAVTGNQICCGRQTMEDIAVTDDLMDSHLAQMGMGATATSDDSPHPYEAEINALVPGKEFEINEPVYFGRLEDTPLIMVNTKKELDIMIAELKQVPEIAIDLEHHDLHSYHGFTCLIQLSSRSKDYIVDPFGLFEELHVLNEVTCNPAIVKVLHGADRDIQWLQRDFGVYVVNMFDTGQACRVLGLPGGASLRNLYELKCGFSPDKKHQTSDWRQRPLPQEMIAYARSDTHYLLYAYDVLKQDLETQEMIMRVWMRSRDLTLQRYRQRQPKFEEMATKIASKHGKGQLKVKHFAALESLLAWRDQEAREADVNPRYCCPDHVCFVLAQKLPAANQIGQAIHPLPYPPRVRAKAEDVVRALQMAPLTPAMTPAVPPPAPRAKSSLAMPPMELPEVQKPRPKPRLLRSSLSKPVLRTRANFEHSLLPMFDLTPSRPPSVPSTLSAIFDDIASSFVMVHENSFTLAKEPAKAPIAVENAAPEATPFLASLRATFTNEVSKKRDLIVGDTHRSAKRRKKNKSDKGSAARPEVVHVAPMVVPAPPMHKNVMKHGKGKKKGGRR